MSGEAIGLVPRYARFRQLALNPDFTHDPLAQKSFFAERIPSMASAAHTDESPEAQPLCLGRNSRPFHLRIGK
jgi:hypothetical protein